MRLQYGHPGRRTALAPFAVGEVSRAAGSAFPFAGVKALSIGPITSATLRELGWPPDAEANPHDIPGLVAAVISQF